jgi:aspartate kinase
MEQLTVVKIGGSLIDFEGTDIPRIVQQLRATHTQDGRGPLLVVSAPKGVTNYLIKLGEQAAKSEEYDLRFPFNEYRIFAKKFIHSQYLTELHQELNGFEKEIKDALKTVNKRFERNCKTIVLTRGGELPTAAIFDYILRSQDLKSTHIRTDEWHIITDENYEDAEPNYRESKSMLTQLIKEFEDRKIVCQGGFLGKTIDGLDTLLGRGGSDLTAVFNAALLKNRYNIKTVLYKDNPVKSADPSIVKDQKLKEIKILTYNEAIKASSTGMQIVQNSAVRCARMHKLPIEIVPLTNPSLKTTITDYDTGEELVKCITGTRNCAIITINSDRSKSLEDCMRLWEGFDNFLDLGTEVLESGKIIRDYLMLEGEFVKQYEERIRNFDNELEIEYGIGIVTLIGDKMKNSPGIASIAVGSIPHMNIKRGVFSPHTSQIILALKESDVDEAISTIHKKLTRALPLK